MSTHRLVVLLITAVTAAEWLAERLPGIRWIILARRAVAESRAHPDYSWPPF